MFIRKKTYEKRLEDVRQDQREVNIGFVKRLMRVNGRLQKMLYSATGRK